MCKKVYTITKAGRIQITKLVNPSIFILYPVSKRIIVEEILLRTTMVRQNVSIQHIQKHLKNVKIY